MAMIKPQKFKILYQFQQKKTLGENPDLQVVAPLGLTVLLQTDEEVKDGLVSKSSFGWNANTKFRDK